MFYGLCTNDRYFFVDIVNAIFSGQRFLHKRHLVNNKSNDFYFDLVYKSTRWCHPAAMIFPKPRHIVFL